MSCQDVQSTYLSYAKLISSNVEIIEKTQNEAQIAFANHESQKVHELVKKILGAQKEIVDSRKCLSRYLMELKEENDQNKQVYEEAISLANKYVHSVPFFQVSATFNEES